MKKHRLMGLVLSAALFSIFLPMALMLLWSVAGRWPWPGLLPETYSLRTIKELLTGSASLPRLLSIASSWLTVAFWHGSRRHEPGPQKTTAFQAVLSVRPLLPLLVPGTVFAMGIQITLIRLGLSDTVAGVVLVHLVAAVPYCITIMTDVTRAVGTGLEEQAMVLGAGPVKAFFLTTFPSLLPGILSSMSMGFILSYSQYFTTLMVGGGRVKTIALVLVPYIQSGDRSLSSVYSTAFVGSALLVFFIFEGIIHRIQKGERKP
ncbi:MAG: ABC transporter permease [Enterocloster sp.]